MIKYISILFLSFSLMSFSWVDYFIQKQDRVERKANGPYDKNWTKVDSLTRKGLFKSALTEVTTIFDLAKKNRDDDHVIKATIYKINYNQFLLEDDFVLAFNDLKTLIAKSEAPTKQIYHSLLAELYKDYYNNNRYTFYNRTFNDDINKEDVRTWDLRTLFNEIIFHYNASLEKSGILKNTNILDYKLVLLNHMKEGAKLRPTLFDFLSYRAIEFLETSEPDIDRPEVRFTLSNPDFYKASNLFYKLDLKSEDTLSSKFYALKMYQELERFHHQFNNKEALVHANLNRLNFVNKNYSNDDAFKQYEAALIQLEKVANHNSKAEVIAELAELYQGASKSYYYENEETHQYKKYATKAKELCENAIAKYPDNYGRQRCEQILYQLNKKSISLRNEHVIPSNTPGKYLIESKNVKKLYARLVPISWEFDQSYRNSQKLDTLRTIAPSKSWVVNLNHDDDLMTHTFEGVIPAARSGLYALMLSENENFKSQNNAVAISFISVSNISYLENENGKSADLIFLHRITGQPLAGVKVDVFKKDYDYKLRKYIKKKVKTYTADKNGKLTISKLSYGSYYIHSKHRNEELEIDDYIYFSRRYNSRDNSNIKTNFFIDRGIYRPGQEMHFKGIVIKDKGDNNLSLMKGYTETVELVDPNYQVVAKMKVTTNEYGSYSGAFNLPIGGMNGRMRIRTENGSKNFRMEEYKRPKFEVEFKPVTGVYKLGQEITIKGKAKAFAGNAIDGAEVNYNIQRSSNYANWRYFSRWSYGSSIEIDNGTITTDENGNFEIKFIAKEDPSLDKKGLPTYSYNISADVVDVTGETRSGETSVKVGYTAMTLSTSFSETVDISENIKTYKVFTKNLNYTAVAGKGNLKIFKLNSPDKLYRSASFKSEKKELNKAEYAKKFPFDYYGDELDKSKWEKGAEVYSDDFSAPEKDSVNVDLTKLEIGYYKMEATAIDSFGQEVTTEKIFILTNHKGKKIAEKTPFRIDGVNTTCQPGETAKIMLSTSYKNALVLFEVENKDRIEHSEWIKISDAQKIIEYKIEEQHRGNVAFHFTMLKRNRKYQETKRVYVGFGNKKLALEFKTYRNKLLPGQKEEWTVTVKGPKGEKVAAEMLAAMYDKSLDEFSSNYFNMYPYRSHYFNGRWSAPAYGNAYGRVIQSKWNAEYPYAYRYYPSMNWFGSRNQFYSYKWSANQQMFDYEESAEEMEDSKEGTITANDIAKMPSRNVYSVSSTVAGLNNVAEAKKEVLSENIVEEKLDLASGETASLLPGHNRREDLTKVKARTNLNETAFFYPHLKTNRSGEVVVSFTIPEALTKWKFIALAHTQDLKIGSLSEEVVTQKELMVTPNAPRFFREGDEIEFTAKVANLSDKDLNGTAQLFLFDALTNKPLDVQFNNNNAQLTFKAKQGQSDRLSWKLSIPEGISTVTYKVVAKADNFTDGEENALPILSNRILVTESLPLHIRKAGTKTFKLNNLVNNTSTTLKHENLTLEFTANPAWYAIQAMPYMMEYPYECSEQTFTRFYANSIASHIMNSNPKIKKVIDSWKNASPNAFLSNLEKNQELKAVILEETPWVLQAKDESERKRRVALLFDLNKMSYEQQKAIKKLKQAQTINGGWPWFKGMKESRYITQHIVTGLGRMKRMNIDIMHDKSVRDMFTNGLEYLQGEFLADYNRVKARKDYKKHNQLSYSTIQYLYAKTYIDQSFKDKKMKEAVDFYTSQMKKYWLDYNLYMQGMISLTLNRLGEKTVAIDITKSVKERSIVSEELGMYWKDVTAGYYWYQAPIETQALLIEMMDEVAGDLEAIEDMKAWLIKNKQTNDWKTTKATAEACYALLMRGTEVLSNTEFPEIKVGKSSIVYNQKSTSNNEKNVTTEAGTGYFKTSWDKDEITNEMGNVSVTKKTNGVAYGSLYWQYFEDLDKIKWQGTPLQIQKELFKVIRTTSGEEMVKMSNTNLKPGDKIRVKIILKSDRGMEYVHMKDMRASGFEPTTVFSNYRYQDGLGYYQVTKDASTNFFFDYLPKGTHVFEYDLRVIHKGDFSNGITTIQSVYAPEFTSHSAGVRVNVKGEK